MLETLGEDYIRTARAKGLSKRVILGRHTLRAVLTPLVTLSGVELAGLLGGAIITESVFNFNGVGRLSITAIQRYDLPLVVGDRAAGGVVRDRRQHPGRPALRRHRPADPAGLSP